MGVVKAALYKDLRLFIKKRGLITIALLFFVFLYILLNFLSPTQIALSKINLLLVNNDDNEIAEELLKTFATDNLFNVSYLNNSNINLDEILQNRTYDAIIIIPKGFKDKLTELNSTELIIYVISNNDSLNKLIFYTIKSNLNDFLKSNLQLKIINKINNETEGRYSDLLRPLLNPIKLNATLIYIKEIDSKERTFYSFYLQSVFFSSLLLISFLTVYERSAGLSRIIYARSKNGLEMLFSKVILSLLILLINVTIFIIAGYFLVYTQFYIEGMLLYGFIILLFSLGFALLMPLFSKKEEGIITLEIIFVVLFFLLTGLIADDFKPLSLDYSPIHLVLDMLKSKTIILLNTTSLSSIGVFIIGSIVYLLRLKGDHGKYPI